MFVEFGGNSDELNGCTYLEFKTRGLINRQLLEELIEQPRRLCHVPGPPQTLAQHTTVCKGHLPGYSQSPVGVKADY